MEPQTRFNLDQAVAAWRAELASHPGPAPEDLRTLEAHLRDGFAALQGGQLTDEEVFHIVCRRVGPPEPVADEFAKAAPKRVWGLRIFWLITGIYTYRLWTLVISRLESELSHLLFQNISSFYSHPSLGFNLWKGLWMVMFDLVPMVLAIFWLVRGAPGGVAKLLSTRKRVAALTLGAILFFFLFHEFILPFHSAALRRLDILYSLDPWGDLENLLPFISYNTCMIGLMIWLAPGETEASSNTKTPGKKKTVVA